MAGAVSEFEILQATALWFVQTPPVALIDKICLSPPRGRGLPPVEEQKRILGERLSAAGFNTISGTLVNTTSRQIQFALKIFF